MPYSMTENEITEFKKKFPIGSLVEVINCPMNRSCHSGLESFIGRRAKITGHGTHGCLTVIFTDGNFAFSHLHYTRFTRVKPFDFSKPDWEI